MGRVKGSTFEVDRSVYKSQMSEHHQALGGNFRRGVDSAPGGEHLLGELEVIFEFPPSPGVHHRVKTILVVAWG